MGPFYICMFSPRYASCVLNFMATEDELLFPADYPTPESHFWLSRKSAHGSWNSHSWVGARHWRFRTWSDIGMSLPRLCVYLQRVLGIGSYHGHANQTSRLPSQKFRPKPLGSTGSNLNWHSCLRLPLIKPAYLDLGYWIFRGEKTIIISELKMSISHSTTLRDSSELRSPASLKTTNDRCHIFYRWQK